MDMLWDEHVVPSALAAPLTAVSKEKRPFSPRNSEVFAILDVEHAVESPLRALRDGRVTKVLCEESDRVDADVPLVELGKPQPERLKSEV